jgi:hypothetical protein
MPRAGSRPHSAYHMDGMPGVVVPGGHVTPRTRHAPEPGSSAAGAARGPVARCLDPIPLSITYPSPAPTVCAEEWSDAQVVLPYLRHPGIAVEYDLFIPLARPRGLAVWVHQRNLAIGGTFILSVRASFQWCRASPLPRSASAISSPTVPTINPTPSTLKPQPSNPETLG